MAKLYEQIHDQTLRLTPKSNSSRADRKESDFATLKMNVEEIATELRDLVNLESRVISYKWLSRNYAIKAEEAKSILASFARDNPSTIHATFIVFGMRKHQPLEYIMKVVDEKDLDQARSELTDASDHVFSVAPASLSELQPLDALLTLSVNQDKQQSLDLVKGCLDGDVSPTVLAFKTNHASSINWKPPVRAPRTNKAAYPTNTAAVASSSAADAKAKPPVAVPSSTPAAPKPAPKPPAPAPASKKSNPAFSMFNKPPASKTMEPPPLPKQIPPSSPTVVAPAVVAPGGIKRKDETEESPSLAVGAKKSKRTVRIDDSDEEGDEDRRAMAPVTLPEKEDEDVKEKRTSAGGKRKAKAEEEEEVEEEEGEGEKEGPKPSKARSSQSKAAKKNPPAKKNTKDADENSDPVEVNASEPTKTTNSSFFKSTAVANAPGGGGGGGGGAAPPARHRVLRTTYNEKGEEVTEEVWEGGAPSGEPAEAAAAAPDPAPSKVQSTMLKAPPAAAAAASKPTSKAASKGSALSSGQTTMKSFFSKK